MNKELKLQIIAHLERLGNGEIKPIYLKRGVCSEILDEFDIFLEDYLDFRKYPNFSGDYFYPIPHHQLSPVVAYERCLLWDKRTKYGRERLRFCLWAALYLRGAL